MNSVAVHQDTIVSGSDDMSVRIWDEREKIAVAQYDVESQVTSVAVNGEYIFYGGLDNTVKAINRRKNAIEFACIGHMDTITGISLSKDGKQLVSNSMDNTVKVWDVRPFVLNNDDALRCQYTLVGAQHNFERNLLRASFNHDGTQVTAGSADRMVHVWDIGRRDG